MVKRHGRIADSHLILKVPVTKRKISRKVLNTAYFGVLKVGLTERNSSFRPLLAVVFRLMRKLANGDV